MQMAPSSLWVSVTSGKASDAFWRLAHLQSCEMTLEPPPWLHQRWSWLLFHKMTMTSGFCSSSLTSGEDGFYIYYDTFLTVLFQGSLSSNQWLMSLHLIWNRWNRCIPTLCHAAVGDCYQHRLFGLSADMSHIRLSGSWCLNRSWPKERLFCMIQSWDGLRVFW